MKYSHEQLDRLSRPASDTETEKLERAINQVKDALLSSSIANCCEVFGKGSYHNNTNVRNNSDVDICVCFNYTYRFTIPRGSTLDNHGITLSDDEFSFDEFKQKIISLLENKFGRWNVEVKNKCIHIEENTYHSNIDVVPCWVFRNYNDWYDPYYYEEGTLIESSDGGELVNYPKQHYKNGCEKNKATNKRYKRVVRIVKNLNLKIKEQSWFPNSRITSFLIESLLYNVPNDYYTGSCYFDWNDILRDCILYLRRCININQYNNWTEVSGLIPLFGDRKWDLGDVKSFLEELYSFLGY